MYLCQLSDLHTLGGHFTAKKLISKSPFHLTCEGDLRINGKCYSVLVRYYNRHGAAKVIKTLAPTVEQCKVTYDELDIYVSHMITQNTNGVRDKIFKRLITKLLICIPIIWSIGLILFAIYNFLFKTSGLEYTIVSVVSLQVLYYMCKQFSKISAL